ncbi:MAG: hypothetical protein NVS1B1_02740 [Candidatus Limnocylindrales bacterium]
MTVTAEVPLVCSAAALCLVALLLALHERTGRRWSWIASIALGAGIAAVAAPILVGLFVDPTRLGGNALWEWSAAGGPTILASYRFDGLAEVGVAVGAAYTVAALFGARRMTRRHPLLPGALLAMGLVFIALAVTEDLIAASVVLGVLGALTVLGTVAVAPLPATTRVAAYLAVGIQFFVLAALLISRAGGASFRFDAILPTAVSPGVVLACSIGAALFAGLYPFIPWRYERAQARAASREPLRGVVTMSAGAGATLVLLRLIGVTRADVTTITLPHLPDGLGLGGVLVIAALVFAVALQHRAVPRRALVIGASFAGLLAIYPALHWSHLVLIAVLATVLYASAVSLALPEQWEVVRYDITLAAVWTAIALGTPVAIAGGLFLLVAEALVSVAGSFWMPPHRTYLAVIAGATLTVSGLLVIAVGAFEAADPVAISLGVVTAIAILSLILVHVGRQLDVAAVPLELDAAAAAVAFLATVLLALLLAVPLYRGVTVVAGRPFSPAVAGAGLFVPAIAAFATLFVVVARSLRPFVPDPTILGGHLRALVTVFDPVPAGLAVFRALDVATSRATGAFTAVERRGGVWLATGLIVLLLVWSVR